MTIFKPTVSDFETTDTELRELNERVSVLAEKLQRVFGQHYANMLMKASWDVLKTKNTLSKKREATEHV